ncbi:hypothetical protein LBWT_51680 [Leptolyngbya boryana IAM M-101]|nr:hypothetical protein LBWT_51680 [Leptolyngbya boryana IAM M-101]BAS65547.1 hypothetical protein LBDG_51680 [Leptolyngbya boryana dg5]
MKIVLPVMSKRSTRKVAVAVSVDSSSGSLGAGSTSGADNSDEDVVEDVVSDSVEDVVEGAVEDLDSVEPSAGISALSFSRFLGRDATLPT